MIGEIKTTRRVGDDGEWIVVKHYFVDGVEVSEAEYREKLPEQAGVPMFATAINDAKPLRSDAMAVHPKQIPQVMARNKRHGLNVEYDRHGRPVLRDSGQRKKLMKIEGLKQQNSYYGA